jgi:hypothetical protein
MLSDEERERIKKLYESGMSMMSVHYETGISREKISDNLHDMGVEVRGNRPKKGVIPTETEENLVLWDLMLFGRKV